MRKHPIASRLVSIAERTLAGSIHIRLLLAFVFGVVFLTLIVGLALLVNDLDSNGFLKAVLTVVLALAAASVMGVIPGFFHSELTSKARGRFRMTGSFIAFVLVLYLMFRLPVETVEPNVIDFSVDPRHVAAGAQVRIGWDVEHVDELLLRDATSDRVLAKSVSLQGSLDEQPQRDTTYELKGKIQGKWELLESTSIEVDEPTPTPVPTPVAKVYAQLSDQPVTSLLELANLYSEMCGGSLSFYHAETSNVEQNWEASSLSWLPGALTFSLQGHTGQEPGMFNITDITLEQAFVPLGREIAADYWGAPCASPDPLTFDSYNSLGLVTLESKRSEYDLLDLKDAPLAQLLLDGSDTQSYMLFLVGYEPGLYKLRLGFEYQFRDSGPVIGHSEWFTATVLGPDVIESWYEYGEMVQREHDPESYWPLGFLGLSIENRVARQGGEYLVLGNRSDQPVSLNDSRLAIASCGGGQLYGSLADLLDRPVVVGPDEVVRLWIGDEAAIPQDAVYLSAELSTFGTCVQVGYIPSIPPYSPVSWTPLSQYPRQGIP
ncbi:MAG: hypothetical protein JXA14_18785 [Anaerolineae bacterium]|nr:hypothetical protein [Anaerolineae bacterium]